MKNLLMLRNHAGLTQQALADQFHLSQQTIYKYEHGLAEPDVETMIQFAKFFGVTVDFLIGNEQGEPLQIDYTVDEKETINKLRQLSPLHRETINILINQLMK